MSDARKFAPCRPCIFRRPTKILTAAARDTSPKPSRAASSGGRRTQPQPAGAAVGPLPAKLASWRGPRTGRMMRVMLALAAMAPAPTFAWLESLSSGANPVMEGRARGELEVSHLSASKLHVKMHVDDMDLTATTTNTSMWIGSKTHNRFVIAAERKIVHGHTIAEVRLTDKTFLTVQSKNGRNVMMEVDSSEYSEQQLANMYEESPTVHKGVKHAHAAYQAAMSELFTTHSEPLAAFVDMAWRVGTEHAATGTEYPHTLPLSMLAMEASKAIEWSPPPGSPTHGSSPRRALQSAPSSCSEKGWFSCGSGLYNLPEQHSYGGVAYCCPAGTTGSGGLMDCDAGSYSDSTCTGMCGPSCNCE